MKNECAWMRARSRACVCAKWLPGGWLQLPDEFTFICASRTHTHTHHTNELTKIWKTNEKKNALHFMRYSVTASHILLCEPHAELQTIARERINLISRTWE